MAKPFIPSSWVNDNTANQKAGAVTTLSSSPQEITFSENLNNFKFTPSNAVGPYIKSQGRIVITGHITVGSTITITSEVASLVLTASASPSSLEFFTTTVVTNTAAYREMVAESIADAVNKSLSFFNNYEITLSGSSVTIEGYNYGSNLDFTTLSSSSANTNINNQLGTARYESQNLIAYSSFAKIYVGRELYGQEVDKFDSEWVDTYTVDSSISEANISALVIGDYVSPILPLRSPFQSSEFYKMDEGITSGFLPIPTDDGFGRPKKVMVNYFIEYGDSFSWVVNGDKANFTKGVSGIRYAQLGALDKLLPYNAQDYVWIPNSPKTFTWLTSNPIEKSVTYDSHEYLQLICKYTENDNDFNIEITYNFYDGTSLVVNQPVRSYKEIGGNVSFDVSPLALGITNLENTEGKKVNTYGVRLLWDVNASLSSFSSTQTYKFDRNCYGDKNNVIFVNEFGGWDSLEFRGSKINTLGREVTNIIRALPTNANTIDSISTEVSLNISTAVSSTYQLFSGLMNDEHVKWIKQLGKSSSVFIWDKDESKYRNILISEFDYSDDNRVNSNNISITYTYTTQDNSIRR